MLNRSSPHATKHAEVVLPVEDDLVFGGIEVGDEPDRMGFQPCPGTVPVVKWHWYGSMTATCGWVAGRVK